MATKLYVGNLPFSASENGVRDLFAQYGEVHSAKLVSDRDTGRPRGFGFVELEPDRQFMAGYWVEYTRDRTFISGDTKWVRQPH